MFYEAPFAADCTYEMYTAEKQILTLWLSLIVKKGAWKSSRVLGRCIRIGPVH